MMNTVTPAMISPFYMTAMQRIHSDFGALAGPQSILGSQIEAALSAPQIVDEDSRYELAMGVNSLAQLVASRQAGIPAFNPNGWDKLAVVHPMLRADALRKAVSSDLLEANGVRFLAHHLSKSAAENVNLAGGIMTFYRQVDERMDRVITAWALFLLPLSAILALSHDPWPAVVPSIVFTGMLIGHSFAIHGQRRAIATHGPRLENVLEHHTRLMDEYKALARELH